MKRCFSSHALLCILLLVSNLLGQSEEPVLQSGPAIARDDSPELAPNMTQGSAPENRPARVPPIPLPGPDHQFTADLNKTYVEWLRKQISAGIRSRNPRAPWLDDALDFIREAASHLHPKSNKAPYTGLFIKPSEDLVKRGAALIQKGANDPLMIFVVGWLENNTVKPKPSRILQLADSWIDLLNGPESPAIHLLATYWLWLELVN